MNMVLGREFKVNLNENLSTVTDLKNHAKDIIEKARTAPQLISRKSKIEAVVLDYDTFLRMTKMMEIAEHLDISAQIEKQNSEFINEKQMLDILGVNNLEDLCKEEKK